MAAPRSPGRNGRPYAARSVRFPKALAALGALAFLGFCILLAPAGLLGWAVERVPGLSLVQAQGTLWSGEGRLLFQGQDWGRLAWLFRPAALLRLSLGFSWTLGANDRQLAGALDLAPGRISLAAEGALDAAPVNFWLAEYDLRLEGDFQIDAMRIDMGDNRVPDIRGAVHWSGGAVQYVLSCRSQTVQLPALVARLGFNEKRTAKVFVEGSDIPLLEVRLLEDGFVKIGMTKRLTQLVDDPWPGKSADDAVVLAVEEKLF